MPVCGRHLCGSRSYSLRPRLHVVTDFFCGAPNTGNAINVVAAKQLIKPKRLVPTKTLGLARRTFNSSLHTVADAP